MWLVLKLTLAAVCCPCSGRPAALQRAQLQPLAQRLRPARLVLHGEMGLESKPGTAPRASLQPPSHAGVGRGSPGPLQPSPAPAALPSPCSPVAAWRAAAGEGRAPTGWAPWASWTPRCRWLSPSPPWGRSCCWSWCPSRNGNWGKEPWGVKRIRVRQERSPVLGLGMMKSLLGQCQAQVPELGHPELWLRSWCP